MRSACAFTTALLAVTLLACPALAQDSVEVFDPLDVLTLNLTMDSDDWTTIQGDETFDIEKEAWFWADGEDKILVSVRRKSADALGQKISLKIDVNEYVSGQTWHDLAKLSLENGDDTDVVAEGFAWYLHRIAAVASNGGYQPGLAAWVKLYVNGDYLGVYVNVEQPDKQFLKNRTLYTSGDTWLYKVGDINSEELKVGEPHSPTHGLLCYKPFWVLKKPKPCATPEGDALETDLLKLIDMDAMLTLGAVNAFVSAPDALFSHGKNFLYADFRGASQKRLYFPWDLDSVFVGRDGSIYGRLRGGKKKSTLQQTLYQEIILNHVGFRAQYDDIMGGLLDGPFALAKLEDFLDDLEVVLTAPLKADSNNNIDGSVAERFDSLRAWIADRILNVKDQLDG